MAGNNRIGSRSIAPQTRRTVGQENIPPQQTQHSGRQPRTRQEAFRDLASAGRAPLQARNLNIGVPQSQARQAPAKPHSMRTSGHGVSIGQAVHNHLEAITRQIQILGKHGGKSAWERPLKVAKLVKARLPQLPAAKSIALLKELQSILGNPNTRERHSALASFVADNRLVQGAAVARPAPAPYAAKPAPMPHAARPVPAPARGMGRPVAAPQPQPAKRVFKSFEELATARPFSPAARPSPAPQPSRLNHSFDARGEVASLRNRPAATAAPARTASAPPQYGRSGSAGARPAAQPQPQFELQALHRLRQGCGPAGFGAAVQRGGNPQSSTGGVRQLPSPGSMARAMGPPNRSPGRPARNPRRRACGPIPRRTSISCSETG
ncbi:hypothetical protein [Ralstonia syzygii]|uniref:hypothetical protein n=1 Tax=Ralstonia syzygii TaxID=28097 RepID=UPI001E4E14A7|nr:hypothetical protein [Ralstonia syzygii]